MMTHLPHLIQATIFDYPLIQNMARFYVYDLSRECGFISDEWTIPADGLYESFDFKCYFEDPSRRAFLVKVDEEIAGFVLLNQVCSEPHTTWNMGEFFILAKFQGQGIGQHIAFQVWDQFPDRWEVSVIPENKSALQFWQTTISRYTSDVYQQQLKIVDYDPDQSQRIVFSFNTKKANES